MLLSGRGSNFIALADAIEAGQVPGEIAIVFSNVANAPGIDEARRRGLRVETLPHDGLSRSEHELKVLASLAVAGAEWICLAGYMRLLSASFVDAYPQRILNIHPSLLPAFPGLHPQRQALAAGVRISGCTVHFVDRGLDSGPIVEQRAVPVLEADDENSLAARILVAEHRAYPEALAALLSRRWRISGKRVLFEAPAEGT